MMATQQLDNSLKFKFVWLNSGELVHLQSRGLSLEICGYLPISLGNQPDYLKDLISSTSSEEKRAELLNIGKTLVDYKVNDGNSKLNQSNYPLTFIFPGMNYTANGTYIVPSTSPNYKLWLTHYYNHLFTNIRALNTTEMKFQSEDLDPDYGNQEQPAASGSIQISYDISNETFGTYISNSFYVDAIMLFGQAYNNRAFVDETQEEQIQKIVPLGLVVYADDREAVGESENKQRPYIQPGKMNEVVQRETICVSLVQGDFNLQAIANDENLAAWKEYAGRIHLVNDNLTTNAKFLLTGNKLTTKGLDAVDKIAELSGSRTFAMHDRLYMGDFDNNFDDCNDDFSSPAMITCMTSAQAGFKNPQVIMGQVSKAEGNTYTGNIWDGVAHSYWTEYQKSQSGSMYNIDWIGEKRPGINIFSNELYHLYTDTNLKGTSESATFGGGVEILSNNSYTSRYATNFLGSNNYLRGDSLAVASQYINFYQNDFNVSAISASPDNNHSVGNVFINSEYITASGTGGGTDYITSIAADNIWLHGQEENINTARRVTLVNAENQDISDCNRVLLLNVKGSSESSNCTKSHILRSKNSIIGNGYNYIDFIEKTLILGNNNYIKGRNRYYPAYSCQVLGTDNTVVSLDAKYGHPTKLTLIGHNLKSDQRQQIFLNTLDPAKVLILGQDNNNYAQLGLKGGGTLTNWYNYGNSDIFPTVVKQVVIGGWKPANVKNNIVSYNMAEFGVNNTTTNESLMNLMDIKGRTISYSSRGISVGVQETQSQDNYNKYNFKTIGSINWAKLIQLLHRLKYDEGTGAVSYSIGDENLNDTTNRSRYMDSYDGSVRFYDLVRNDVGGGPWPSNMN